MGSSLPFDGRVAVVTGGGSGIGREAVVAFVESGARVVVADVAADRVEESVSMVEDRGGQALGIVIDVSRSEDVRRMIDVAVREFGGLDFLFNNAGISGYNGKPMCEMDDELFDRVVGVNLRGVWLGMKHAIPEMIARGGGAIVNTASALGLIGGPYCGPYAATKHGVLGLTKTAAIEYGRQGVRVNAVCPGGVETPIARSFKATMTPADWEERNRAAYPATGRYGTPREIADVVVFLCSDQASNIHGAAIPVDGGYTAQ